MSVKRNRPLKQRRRGLDEAAYVESFLALNAVGGEGLDDFEVLREDWGLPTMLGDEPPSPAAANRYATWRFACARSKASGSPTARAPSILA